MLAHFLAAIFEGLLLNCCGKPVLKSVWFFSVFFVRKQNSCPRFIKLKYGLAHTDWLKPRYSNVAEKKPERVYAITELLQYKNVMSNICSILYIKIYIYIYQRGVPKSLLSSANM